MRAGGPPESDDAHERTNRLGVAGGAGEFVQARDVHGGVHFHHAQESFIVVPRQLPGHDRGFVNRRMELERLTTVLAVDGDTPLVVVITGTAGVGKTSLALRWAHTLGDRFPDGQLYANLRGYDPGPPAEPDDVLGRFLRDLGVPARAIPPSLEERASLFRSISAERRLLVVLDNAATVRQVRPLVPGAPGCLVVVTSRSRMSGLMAREGAVRLQLDLLDENDAVALLRTVTTGHRPEDRHDDLLELARLCARLPLALRIAAERAASRPRMLLTELIADLRDESGLWDALTLDGDEEADAVRTVFAWSYRALTESAARMFRFLGLHPGDEFGVSAAAALSGVAVTQARHDLDALVGAQLIEHSGQSRCRFHDLLRAYAIDQVREWETDKTRGDALRRVLSWYLHTADSAQGVIAPHDRYVLSEPVPDGVSPIIFDDYETALIWYRIEVGNLVDAVRLAFDHRLHVIAWKLAAVMRAIHMNQNAFDDWIAVGRIGLESAVRLGDLAAQAQVSDSLGKAYFQSGVLDRAEEHHEGALRLHRELGDRFGEAVSVNAMGLLALRMRRLDDARQHFLAGIDIFLELGELRWVALLRTSLAAVLSERGDFGDAVVLAREALGTFRELGDRFGQGNGLFSLARALRRHGQLVAARTAIDSALTIATEDDNQVWEAYWRAELANIQLAQGEVADALTNFQRAAVLQRTLGDRSREAMAIAGAGDAYLRLGHHEDAMKFYRAAATTHRDLRENWNLATTLDQLARAVNYEGDRDQARRHWEEAATLLADFDDPVAASLGRRIGKALRRV